jgi:hypothetical protein
MPPKIIYGPLLHKFELLGEILEKPSNDQDGENGENRHYNSQKLSSIIRQKRVNYTHEVEPFPMVQALRRATMSLFAFRSAIKYLPISNLGDLEVVCC